VLTQKQTIQLHTNQFKNKNFILSTKYDLSDLEIVSEKSEVRCDSITHVDLRTNDALAISFCLT